MISAIRSPAGTALEVCGEAGGLDIASDMYDGVGDTGVVTWLKWGGYIAADDEYGGIVPGE